MAFWPKENKNKKEAPALQTSERQPRRVTCPAHAAQHILQMGLNQSNQGVISHVCLLRQWLSDSRIVVKEPHPHTHATSKVQVLVSTLPHHPSLSPATVARACSQSPWSIRCSDFLNGSFRLQSLKRDYLISLPPESRGPIPTRPSPLICASPQRLVLQGAKGEAPYEGLSCLD